MLAETPCPSLPRTCSPKLRQGASHLALATDHLHREKNMHISPSIFKAYDIGGIVPSTINADMARGLGRAFGTVAMAEGETTVAIGRDGHRRVSRAAVLDWKAKHQVIGKVADLRTEAQKAGAYKSAEVDVVCRVKALAKSRRPSAMDRHPLSPGGNTLAILDNRELNPAAPGIDRISAVCRSAFS